MSVVYNSLSNSKNLSTGPYLISSSTGNNGDILELDTSTGTLTLGANDGGSFIIPTRKMAIPNTIIPNYTGTDILVIDPSATIKATTSNGLNVYLGSHAADINTGYDNVIIGANSGINSNANYQTVVGSDAGYNCTGASVTLVGRASGHFATTSHYASCFGSGSGFYITTGQALTMLGHNAGPPNGSGNINNTICIGEESHSSTSNMCQLGADGTAGTTAVNLLKLGSTNVLDLSKGTSNNQLHGCSATYTGTSSNNINISGTTITGALSSVSDCVSLGYQSLYRQGGGGFNTAIGAVSLSGASFNTSYVTAVGRNAGSSISSGAFTTVIGASCASNLTTGRGGFYAGYNAQPSSATVNNEIVIGTCDTNGTTSTIGAGANSCQLGNSSVTLMKLGSYTAQSQPNSTSRLIGCNASGTVTGTYNLISNAVENNAITSSPSNSIYGSAAGINLSTGSGRNTLIGISSGGGTGTNTMAYNVGVGGSTISGANNTAQNCVCLGDSAGINIISSNSVICVGKSSGLGLSGGSGDIYIGREATPSSSTATNEIVLAAGSSATTGFGNNTCTIGDSSCTAIVPSTGTTSLGAASRPYSAIWLENAGSAPVCGVKRLDTPTAAAFSKITTISTTAVSASSIINITPIYIGGTSPAATPANAVTVQLWGINPGSNFSVIMLTKDTTGGFIGDEVYDLHWTIIQPTS